MMYRRLPVPVVTLNTVAPTLMRIGSEAQKQEYLPRILRGEIEFAIGYSEPGAGTDLASLETRAVRDGDNYVDQRPEGVHLRRAPLGLRLARRAHRS